MSIKLEVGKRYITRGGWVTPPLLEDAGDTAGFPFYVGDLLVSSNGDDGNCCWTLHGGIGGGENEMDLIAEYHEPAPAGWILCSERMPTKEEDVVLWIDAKDYAFRGEWHYSPQSRCQMVPIAWLPIPKFTPPEPEPKLPDPPPGRQWHSPEAITVGMLREGWRPLLVGEDRLSDDEIFEGRGEWVRVGGQAARAVAGVSYRTKRPIPVEPVRLPLGPEDVSPGSVIRAIGAVGWLAISEVTLSGVTLAKRRDEVDYETLMRLWEISRGGGKTWEPCWKEAAQ